jgi:hypothetical protein
VQQSEQAYSITSSTSGEQHRWHIDAERFRGLQVDHQLVLGRRLHGQVGGFGNLIPTWGDLASGSLACQFSMAVRRLLLNPWLRQQQPLAHRVRLLRLSSVMKSHRRRLIWRV